MYSLQSRKPPSREWKDHSINKISESFLPDADKHITSMLAFKDQDYRIVDISTGEVVFFVRHMKQK